MEKTLRWPIGKRMCRLQRREERLPKTEVGDTHVLCNYSRITSLR